MAQGSQSFGEAVQFEDNAMVRDYPRMPAGGQREDSGKISAWRFKRRLLSSQEPAWGLESCWREDSQTGVREVAPAAAARQKPFHSSRSIPNRRRKHPSAFRAVLQRPSDTRRCGRSAQRAAQELREVSLRDCHKCLQTLESLGKGRRRNAQAPACSGARGLSYGKARPGEKAARRLRQRQEHRYDEANRESPAPVRRTRSKPP